MAQIMEFIINLLLLRGKFLTTTAAETFHEAIKKCMQFKSKISMEFKSGQAVAPFENMLDFVNYNARQYKCEGGNYVVTSQVQYNLLSKDREKQNLNQFLSKEPTERKQIDTLKSAEKKMEEEPKKTHVKEVPEFVHRESNQLKNNKKTFNEDHIVDNLRAIIKSQEFLFKNMIKLVDLLEKDEILVTKSNKLTKMKKKIAACTDILSNSVHSHQFSNIINNIIEEEITRCRFRLGENKTSREISLKFPKPEGLAAALDIHKTQETRKVKGTHENQVKISKSSEQEKHIIKPERKNEVLRKDEIKLEAETESAKFLRRVKSEAVMSSSRVHSNKLMPTKTYESILNQIQMESENAAKLIQINEEHFRKIEDTLWHSLTTTKYLSLKDDYLNMCRCAYYNKKHFVATEAVLSKKMKQEEDVQHFQKFVDVSNSMFQITESKLLFETVKQELKNIGQLPLAENALQGMVPNPFLKLKEGLSNNHPKANKPQQTESNEENIIKLINDRKKQNSDNFVEASQAKPQQAGTIIVAREQKSKLESFKTQEVLKNQNTNTTIKRNDQHELSPQFDEIHITVINKNNLQELMSNIGEGINSIESQKKIEPPLSSQETNTINSLKLLKADDESKIEQKVKNEPNISEIHCQHLNKLEEKYYEKDTEVTNSFKLSRTADEGKTEQKVENVSNMSENEIQNLDKSKEIYEEKDIELINSIKLPKTADETKVEQKVENVLNISRNQARNFSESRAKIKENDIESNSSLKLQKPAENGNIEQKIDENVLDISENPLKNLKSKEEYEDKDMNKSDDKASDRKKQNITNAYEFKKYEDILPVTERNFKLILRKTDIKASKTPNISKVILPQNVTEKVPQENKRSEKFQDNTPQSEDVKKPSFEQQANQSTSSLPGKVVEDLYARKFEKNDDNIPLKSEEKKNEHIEEIVSSAVSVMKKEKEKLQANLEKMEKDSHTTSDNIQHKAMKGTSHNTSTITEKKGNEFSEEVTNISSTKPPKTKEILKVDQRSRSLDSASARQDKKKQNKKNVSWKNKKEIFTNINSTAEEKPSIQFQNEVENNKKKENKVTDILEKASLGLQEKQTKQQKTNEKSLKLQTVPNKIGKLLTVNDNSLETLPNKQKLNNEADLIKINKKAFEELEATIHSVRIIVDKTSSKSSKTMKTTTETKKRKIDEPMKKNMSTRRHVSLKQQSITYKDIEINSFSDKKFSLYKEIRKQTNKYSLPTEKTFLKTSKSSCQKKEQNDSLDFLTQYSTVDRIDQKEKPSSQMRRTTKNAMKRQQVQNILPNQKNEKKNTPLSLVEIEEINTADLQHKKPSKQNKRYMSVMSRNTYKGVTKNVASPTVRNSLAKRLLKEVSKEKVHCVMWETEDDFNIPDILKH